MAARAFSRACAKTGNRMAARMAMMAMTTSNSISVNARRRVMDNLHDGSAASGWIHAAALRCSASPAEPVTGARCERRDQSAGTGIPVRPDAPAPFGRLEITLDAAEEAWGAKGHGRARMCSPRVEDRTMPRAATPPANDPGMERDG